MYPGVYEVGDVRELFGRYGLLLGVSSLVELYSRLDLQPGAAGGVIHLEDITEFERPVTLRVLRDEGVSFARNIVSGRSLSLEDVATIFELAGLGVPDDADLAAEGPAERWT